MLFQLCFFIGLQYYFCWEADWWREDITQHHESGKEVRFAELAERVLAFPCWASEKRSGSEH